MKDSKFFFRFSGFSNKNRFVRFFGKDTRQSPEFWKKDWGALVLGEIRSTAREKKMLK